MMENIKSTSLTQQQPFIFSLGKNLSEEVQESTDTTIPLMPRAVASDLSKAYIYGDTRVTDVERETTDDN